jgi:DNA-binding Lrp family transcriptional regulator
MSADQATRQFDDHTASILNRLQTHIPLVPRPYQAIGEEIGLSENDVLTCLRQQRSNGVIRELSAIFDTRTLGYQSSLVAAKYPAADLNEAAAAVSRHPGVSHNYSRDHEFNLWYTIAVPPGRPLEADVQKIGGATGAIQTLLLPTLRTFKIGVNFAVGGEGEGTGGDQPRRHHGGSRGATGRHHGSATLALSETDIRAVRALQEDLPAEPRPFEALAAASGFDSDEDLLAAGESLRERGAMRRYAAVLHHREVGYSANGMAVWVASQEECDVAGPIMASFDAVSHCYQRPTHPEWPYSLFTMIHGQTRAEVEACVIALKEATGLTESRPLYSIQEYKKARVRYFDSSLDAWDREMAGAVPVSGGIA